MERLRYEKTKTMAVIKLPPQNGEDDEDGGNAEDGADVIDGPAKVEEIQKRLKEKERIEEVYSLLLKSISVYY